MDSVVAGLWILLIFVGEVVAPIAIFIFAALAVYAYFVNRRRLLIISIILIIPFVLARLYTSNMGWSM